ncbi:hypothetical protein ABH903_001334 [Brevibacterium epidermidis]|uniref:Uncharacterized protein n=1 Tax=Brevibacterium epidermidis TaxID=1698 RepID=A0ABV4EIM5_BREEP
MFILPFVDAMLGAVYVLAIVGLMFVRAMLGAVDVARGLLRYRRSARVDWAARLTDLERAMDGRPSLAHPRGGFRAADHAALVAQVSADPRSIMRPSTLLHAVVVAAYNEPYPVIADTIRTLLHTSTKPEQLLVFFAHEERGGPAMAETARRLEAEYGHRFGAFVLVEHPAGLPDEIAGKGANITFAGHRLAEWVRDQAIDPRRVIVTSPLGGVGVNLAVQDGIAVSRMLAEPLRSGSVRPSELRRLQLRRLPTTRAVEFLQSGIHRMVEPAVHGHRPIRPPAPVEWLLTTFPALTRIPARILGIGITAEHAPDFARDSGFPQAASTVSTSASAKTDP